MEMIKLEQEQRPKNTIEKNKRLWDKEEHTHIYQNWIFLDTWRERKSFCSDGCLLQLSAKQMLPFWGVIYGPRARYKMTPEVLCSENWKGVTNEVETLQSTCIL